MTTLQIAVPNIGSLLGTYDVIKVFRAPTRDGPWTEVTGATSGAASLTGTVAEPFSSLNGKSLIVRASTQAGQQPDVSVVFSDPNPVTVAQAVTASSTLGPQILASTDGFGHLVLSTLATGRNTVLKIVGGTATADLGLPLYATAQGSAPYVVLVAGDQQYTYEDPQGTDTSWYRWQFFNTGTLASSALTVPVTAQSARVDPVRRIEDFRATHGLTLVRGRPHTFRMAFWEDEAQQVPLLPLDPGRYPAYSIVDPNGLVVQTGRADLDGQAPNYKVDFTPGLDALLTNEDRRWRLDWFFLTDQNRSVQSSEIWDLRDVDVTESAIKEQKYLLMDGQSKWFRYAVDRRPTSLSLQIENANQTTIKVLPLPAVWPPSGPNPSLTEIQDGDRYVYCYEVPSGMFVSGTNGQTYQAIWTHRDTPLSEENIDIQVIDTVPRNCLQYFPALRMQIDKFQKQRDMLQAYQESDIYEYLQRGLQWINGMSPIHLAWSMGSVPGIVQPYWLLASLWWGLNAQQGLEIDLSFSFGGQTATLDYNHADALAGWADRFKTAMQEGFGPLKMQLYRKNSPVGSYAGRAMRRVGQNAYVFPIARDVGGTNVSPQNSLMALMTQIGLI